jgi:citrate synthase
MRYGNTDIDRAGIAPDRLEIRGHDLSDLIGCLDPEDMFHLVAFGTVPPPGRRAGFKALRQRVFNAIGPGHPAWRAAAAAKADGARPIPAMIAGLASWPKSPPAGWREAEKEIGLSAEEIEGAVLFFALPRIAVAALLPNPRPPSPAATDGLADAILGQLTATSAPAAGNRCRAFAALLSSFQAGFGHLTPTVKLARTAASTRADLALSVIAGFSGSGPAHVGACDEAMSLLASMREGPLPPLLRAEEAVEAWARRASRIPGFGHPLFAEDPRVPRLRAYWAELKLEAAPLHNFDALCRIMDDRHGLKPNIDGLAAALLLTLALPAGGGSPLFLCMRAAAMIAHALEMRRRPRFGQTRAQARKHLSSLPVTQSPS